MPKVDVKQPKYSTYRLDDEEWAFVTIVHEVLQVRHVNPNTQEHVHVAVGHNRMLPT